MTAKAYIGGAAGFAGDHTDAAGALDRGADIVVTGRLVNSALALGPLVHVFKWRWDDWDWLAAGTLAGHLLECGSQVTGGYFADPPFKDVPGRGRISAR
jgi:hypothetical protein